MVRRQIFDMAISAPVLPAETAQSAAPLRTASIAIHIEEWRRPARKAWLGLSAMPTATLVWRTSVAAFSRGCAFSKGAIFASSPNIRNSIVGIALKEHGRARDDDRRAEIPAHGVERDPHRLFHILATPFRRGSTQFEHDSSDN